MAKKIREPKTVRLESVLEAITDATVTIEDDKKRRVSSQWTATKVVGGALDYLGIVVVEEEK